MLSDKSQFVRRKVTEKFHPDCVINTVKHPQYVMVWSVISGRGTGRLYIVEGTMRQGQYIETLRSRLIPQLKDWFPDGNNFIFQQDSAPCHTAKSVKKFLSDNNIPLLDWPGNSPDLNPIENLWELVKRRMSKVIITNRTDLICKLIEVWHRDEEIQRITSNVIESMPRRISAVIKAKGGQTKY